MSNSAAHKLLLVMDASWCVGTDTHRKMVHAKHLVPLSDRHSRLSSSAKTVTLRLRNSQGSIVIDDDAHLHVSQAPAKATLHSHKLSADLARRDLRGAVLFILLEQVEDLLRATAHFSSFSTLQALDQERPELRLSAFELPPSTVTEIEPSFSRDGMDADSMYEVLLARIQTEDPPLFAAHTETFLKAPHIVVPLLTHLSSLSAEDNLRFPLQLKRLADQFRAILQNESSPLKIHKIDRNHLNVWAEAQGKRFAFADGGVARIAGLPGTEPTALRVGIYAVRAGDVSLESREQWKLYPFVVGDLIDKNTGVQMDEGDQIDLRRLGEAARYTLEPLAALEYLRENSDIEALFSHGPLINQFVQYDEGEPNFLPFLREEFLSGVGVTEEQVQSVIKEIPKSRHGKTMWRQFMAIYGWVSNRLMETEVPFIGVVERSAGTWLAQAILEQAVTAKIINQAYKKKAMTLLQRFNISDDFLFGCVLAEGEYVSPTLIPKNSPRRAREHWQGVVKQYPKPFATVMKTTEVSFPFRVEMNTAAKNKERPVMELLYHTARLLPRYAFPVGLDIVDKYAKVPDWLSKNISARLAAVVLNRAMAEGDTRLIAQIRRLLAHTPRDFFYRPKI